MKNSSDRADKGTVNPRSLILACLLGLLVSAPGASPAKGETWPPPQPEPRAHYASLEAARDSIGAMVSRWCRSHPDTAIHVSREPVTFDYLYAKAKGKGWAYHVTVNDTTTCPHDAFGKMLTDAGWVEEFGYSADGPDGTALGYASKNFFCVVEGAWQGEDDADETYVPPPGCTVTITCVPRRKDDAPPQ